MKKTLPQLDLETGISQDYVNNYAWIFIAIMLKDKEHFLYEPIKQGKIKRYEERFNPAVYDIDFNNPRIELLDEIADYINMKKDKNCLDIEELVELAECAVELIYK